MFVMGATVIMGLGGISRMPISAPPPAEKANVQNAYSGASSSNPAPASSLRDVPCESFLAPPPRQYSIYPHLTIIINGEKVATPSGIGITEDCKRVIHTSDPSGTIDVEPYDDTPFTLGDFMNVWGKRFSGDWLFDYRRDDKHTILMTVDGKPSAEYGNLVLKDGQRIVIEYKEVVGRTVNGGK